MARIVVAVVVVVAVAVAVVAAVAVAVVAAAVVNFSTKKNVPFFCSGFCEIMYHREVHSQTVLATLPPSCQS